MEPSESTCGSFIHFKPPVSARETHILLLDSTLCGANKLGIFRYGLQT